MSVSLIFRVSGRVSWERVNTAVVYLYVSCMDDRPRDGELAESFPAFLFGPLTVSAITCSVIPQPHTHRVARGEGGWGDAEGLGERMYVSCKWRFCAQTAAGARKETAMRRIILCFFMRARLREFVSG